MVITFALEPIGVAFPPKPQPIAKAQYRGIISTSATPVIGSLLNSPISSITGNIAAQKGILSTIADAIAETVDFHSMSKNELEDYGRTVGIELDRRLSKKKLITQLEDHIQYLESV